MADPVLGRAGRKPILIDVDRLVETRMLLQANSGAGKSWAIRRLLEQTHGRCQQIVLDVEGEVYTRGRARRLNGSVSADVATQL